LELLFRIFLLWFTIYTFAVCPEDEQLSKPICRGLHEYRRLVIDPYIIPGIRQALAHPSVAPYVEKAKPYADYAVRTAKPIAARAHKEFDARVVPQWNKRVVPLYLQYAAPQLAKLEAQTEPYRSRVEQEYERVLGPYVRQGVATVNYLQQKARPYVAIAAQKTYDGYQRARPYARPVWEKIRIILGQLLAFLGEQRRQFVDPHVKKIWERVKELSSGKPQSPSASVLRESASSHLSKAFSQVSQASAKISSTVSSIASSAVSGASAVSDSPAKANPPISEVLAEAAHATAAVRSSASVAGDKASSVLSSASDALSSTASVISAAMSPSLSSAVSAASDAVVPPVSSLSSVVDSAVHAPLDGASSVTPEISASLSSLGKSATEAVRDAGSALSSAAGSVASAAASSASSARSAVSSASALVSETVAQALASVPEPAPAVVSPDPKLDEPLSDPDLEAFKAELGLGDDFLAAPPSASSVAAQAPAATPAEPEEEPEWEREARLRAEREKTARDRHSVEKRHGEWERQLNERIAANKKALRKSLVALRKAAAAELKASVHIRNEVEELVEDAEKFLRGAEKYLATLEKEKRTPDEKKLIWERVVGKVDEKFTERLHQTEAVVNGWYQEVLERELAEVKKLTAEIQDIADRAQADVGLDYAYLGDVTYNDWQRYHDLARKSENFTALAHSVQDGSHPSPPINPVLPAIADLQNEVEDVVAGFQTRLRRINRNGARAFDAPEEDAAADAAEAPVAEDDTLSILPIEEPEQTASPADVHVPPVVIGRGKAEVEAALNRAADLEGGKTSSPDDAHAPADPDAVARSIRDEIAGEDTSPSAPHQEL
ncbi:hypothetical protein BD413DRAFT_480869, partial [Trametes elegans]